MKSLHYLESTDSAARRTRTTILVLVAASVLGLAGSLNSFRGGWLHQRLARAAKDDRYAAYHLGYLTDPSNELSDKERERIAPNTSRYLDQLIRNYVDNTMTIRVPFFGVHFDVNDLGLMTGIGFVVILTILRYCLRSEVVALVVGFRAAKQAGELLKFYEVLASRQVFTTPKLRSKYPNMSPSPLTAHLPRIVLVLPLAVYFTIFLNDMLTLSVGETMSKGHSLILVIYTTSFLILIASLAINCWRQWREIDEIWEHRWQQVE